MTRRMSTSDTIETHGFDTARAKAYFADFLEDPTVDFIDDTFEFDADDLGETSDVLLASEIVAAMMGAPAATLPDAIKAAIKGKPVPSKKLMAKTRVAVRGLLDEKSALRQHWTAAGLEPWLTNVKNLLDRLTGGRLRAARSSEEANAVRRLPAARSS